MWDSLQIGLTHDHLACANMLNSTYFSEEGIAAKAEKGILQELGQALGSVTQRAEEPESLSSQSRGDPATPSLANVYHVCFWGLFEVSRRREG